MYKGFTPLNGIGVLAAVNLTILPIELGVSDKTNPENVPARACSTFAILLKIHD